MNKLELSVKMYASEEGYDHPTARVMYDTPNGEKKITYPIHIGRKTLPETEISWLRSVKEILDFIIKIEEKQAEKDKDG